MKYAGTGSTKNTRLLCGLTSSTDARAGTVLAFPISEQRVRYCDLTAVKRR